MAPLHPLVLASALLAASTSFGQTEHLIDPRGVEAAAAGSSTILTAYTEVDHSQPCTCGAIYGRRIAFDGNQSGTSFPSAPSFSAQTQPALAFDDHQFLVVWNELGDPPLNVVPKPSRIWGAFVTESGPSSPFLIADAAVVRPVVLWDGTRFIVFYSDLSMQASAMTVSPQGVTGQPVSLGDGLTTLDAAVSTPAIAVVALHGSDVELLTLDAALHASTPIILGTGASEARVAWNGSTFLAIWNGPGGITARALDGEPHRIAGGSYPHGLRLTTFGSVFVAAWEDYSATTAWITLEPFSMATGGMELLSWSANGPHLLDLVSVPGRGVLEFFVRLFSVNQFFTDGKVYSIYLAPPRHRVAR